ncbi:hypothetical protein HPB47_012978 [Ixodes persulcatus]|uniref:Uncharacterized protein n=1 Tax=Ixodes persulcatus TaxID=34615 RepID=A0AC60NS14_IXOPE|nr:hypothetical protein HPB47_012978 [Ixodes persulcatus]
MVTLNTPDGQQRRHLDQMRQRDAEETLRTQLEASHAQQTDGPTEHDKLARQTTAEDSAGSSSNRTGHIRKECRVPRCESCRRFGHTKEECVRAYADVAHSVIEDDMAEHVMDQAETEEAAGEASVSLEPLSRDGATAGTSVHPPTTSFAAESPTVTAVAQPAVSEPARRLSSPEPSPKDDGSQAVSEAFVDKENKEDTAEDMEALNGSAKRTMEPPVTQEGGQPTSLRATVQERWRTAMAKRVRYHDKPEAPSASQTPRDPR